MFKDKPNAAKIAKKTASYFSKASLHKSHGKRIDRQEARPQQIDIEDLETNQDLQEWVLTAYHLMTIVFEKSPACKILVTNHNKMWIKNAGAVKLPMAPVPIQR